MPENNDPICPCCMERHERRIIRERETGTWRGVSAVYEAEYFWCGLAESYYADERLLRRNYNAKIRAVLEKEKQLGHMLAITQKEEVNVMSYDISLCDPVTHQTLEVDSPHFMTGGTYRLGGTTELWLNVTYNYGKLYYREDVFGEKGIRAIYGMTGAESIPLLEKAAAALGNEVSSDYWEATEGNAKKPLLQLIAMARMRPDGIWEGD